MKRVYVNEPWCLGCHLCEYYCAFANSGLTSMVDALQNKTIHPLIQVEGDQNISFAVNCRHCDDAPCVKACITGALSRDEKGVVVIDQEKCIGCYTCILTCPYGCVMPAEDGRVVQKCELCVNNAMGEPACVKGCPNKAIVYEER